MLQNFGFSLITDPGGPKLLRESEAHNVEDSSKIVIEPGTAALMIINGEMFVADQPGRFPVKTGVSAYFKYFQNIVSKGQSTRTSRFLFFDTNPNVYRDVMFMIPNLICQELSTNLQVEAAPYINMSVRIKDYEPFFYCLRAYDYENSTVSAFLANRVVPWIRSEIYSQTQDQPILDVNANACNFAKGLEDKIQDFVSTFGLDVKCAQIIDLNLSADSKEQMRQFRSKYAEATQDVEINMMYANQNIEIAKQYANQMFGGDMEKAINYLLMNKGISQGGNMGAFNPFAWELSKQFYNNLFNTKK